MVLTEQIYHVTKSIYDHLEKFPEKVKREEYIEKLNSLLDNREKLIKLLPKNVSMEDKKIGKEIVKLNMEIDKQLNHFFDEIKEDIKVMKTKKVANNQYNKQSISMDGMFLDKRK